MLGTQRVESDPERTADGVFAMWYGKGPGVDRAGDALKHGNAYGSSPHGGVLVVAGDDHGCVSSSMPHQSDLALQSWHMPVVAPASVAEYLEFGLYGWALSRFSGNWVGFTALSEVVESGSTVDLDETNARVAAWKAADAVAAATGFVAPADGLHYRWPDLPSLKIEERLHAKLDAVRAFAQVNAIDRDVVDSAARVGRHRHLRQGALRPARGVPPPRHPARCARRRRRAHLQGRPRLPARADPARRVRRQASTRSSSSRRRPGSSRQQLRDLFYNARGAADDRRQARRRRPAARQRARRAAPVAADRDRRRAGSRRASRQLDRRHLVATSPSPSCSRNDGDAVKRVPYFCAGCPHNTSTQVPEGSRAQAGIGCHFMASWMDRDTEGLIQMGGEGVDWVSHAMFTKVPHVFQNLGDGTYYHSGYLAIRQAIAAETNVTYKILFNDAVAMTGGQPVDGIISVDAIARQVEAEGATKVVVVSDDIAKYDAIHAKFPGRHRVPRPRRARRGAAAPARDEGRDDPDLRADLRRREAAPAQEGRARRPGAAPLHQRARLRRLRRLLGAVELRRRAAARDRARAEARRSTSRAATRTTRARTASARASSASSAAG